MIVNPCMPCLLPEDVIKLSRQFTIIGYPFLREDIDPVGFLSAEVPRHIFACDQTVAVEIELLTFF